MSSHADAIFDTMVAITDVSQEAYRQGLAEGERRGAAKLAAVALDARRYRLIRGNVGKGGRVDIYFVPPGSEDWDASIGIRDGPSLDAAVDGLTGTFKS